MSKRSDDKSGMHVCQRVVAAGQGERDLFIRQSVGRATNFYNIFFFTDFIIGFFFNV